MLVDDMGGHGRALEVLQNSLHNRDMDNLDSKSRRGYLTCPYIWIWMTAHFTNDPILREVAKKQIPTQTGQWQNVQYKTDEYVSEVHQCNLLKKRSVNQKIYMEEHENTAADDDILYCKRPFKDLDDCESRTKIPRMLLEQFQLR
ncbi:7990_t:CDS:2 [Entrophospora sp. SA101]|nr:7990_t:CDS:2 [Entrophospora sp. SA101]CAJ0856436.1 9038_t:CDS:2 [Entrophospora sp. SA101]